MSCGVPSLISQFCCGCSRTRLALLLLPVLRGVDRFFHVRSLHLNSCPLSCLWRANWSFLALVLHAFLAIVPVSSMHSSVHLLTLKLLQNSLSPYMLFHSVC